MAVAFVADTARLCSYDDVFQTVHTYADTTVFLGCFFFFVVHCEYISIFKCCCWMKWSLFNICAWTFFLLNSNNKIMHSKCILTAHNTHTRTYIEKRREKSVESFVWFYGFENCFANVLNHLQDMYTTQTISFHSLLWVMQAIWCLVN